MPVAVSADAFVDSIGVNTHWTFPKYFSNITALTLALGQSGIRHIRDHTDTQNAFQRDIIQGLYATYGIKLTAIVLPQFGVVPNVADFWCGRELENTMTIAEYVANYMGVHVVTAVEMLNEIDIFHGDIKWHRSDSGYLTNDNYDDYAIAFTQAAWANVRSAAELNGVKVIGPSIGIVAPSPFADGSLYNYCDYGSVHPYPARVNAFNTPTPYAGIINYYWNTFAPSNNLVADPYNGNISLMFNWYAPPFKSGSIQKPLIATETGYSNGSSFFSVLALTKYLPRLFAEYFKAGIPRSFFYELVDEGNDPANAEQNDGLLYSNLAPKTAMTALTNMIQLLQERGARFTPGQLGYSLTVTPDGLYTRTSYVHDLLLQKSNGDFFLLLWHEFSSSSDTDASGMPILGTQRDITPTPLMTRISLSGHVQRATLYTYDQTTWAFRQTPLVVNDGQMTVFATDTLSVIQIRMGGVPEYIVTQDGRRITTGPGYLASESSS